MSNNLNLPQITSSQNNKYTTANDQSAALDAALTEAFECDVSSGNVTLTAAQYRDAIYFYATGAATSGRTVTLQAIKRLALLVNFSTSDTVDFILGSATVTVAVATDAANPGTAVVYTDGTANGLFAFSTGSSGSGGTSDAKVLQPVRVVATADVDLSSELENGDSLAGVTLATGDRVLLTGQSTGAENGVYVVVASGAASRATDLDEDAEAVYGMLVPVVTGSLAERTLWMLTTTGSITIDSTTLTFEKVSTGEQGLGFYFGGTLVADEERRYVFLKAAVLPADLAGYQYDVGANPSSTTVIDVQKNGVSIGGLSVGTGGVITVTGDLASTAQSFAAGDRLQLIVPGTVNSLGDVTLTILALV